MIIEKQIKFRRCFRVERGTRGPKKIFTVCDNIFYLNTYSNQKSHNWKSIYVVDLTRNWNV